MHLHLWFKIFSEMGTCCEDFNFDYIFSFNDATAPDSHTVTLVFFSFGCIGLGMAAFKLPTHGLDGAVQTVCVSS